ncbi:hypothetical protein ACA910_005685 [Epithemia clementina (nom. ined.)]
MEKGGAQGDRLPVYPAIGETLWPKDTELELLTLAFLFPLLSRAPWRIKHSELCIQQDHLVRTLHQRDVPFAGHYLGKFWTQAWDLETMPDGISQSLLHSTIGKGSITA